LPKGGCASRNWRFLQLYSAFCGMDPREIKSVTARGGYSAAIRRFAMICPTAVSG
jgi:hypothetical protein